MKPKTTLRRFRSLAFASSTLISISYMQAAEYYWDNNGTTAGFGSATGTWVGAGTVGSGTQGWGTDITGLIAPTGTITTLSTNATTDALNFGTGVDGLGAGTITVSGTVQAGGITFGAASGAIDLSGGTINLTAASTVTVNNTTNTISSILSGAGTSFTKAGTGTLDLSGVNTYTGATNVSAGTLTLSGNRTATAGAFNVGNLASSTGTLNVTNGNFTFGTTQVGTVTDAVGIMNQSGGTLTTSGNQLLIGAHGGTGTYNLSDGQLNTIAGALGVTLGVNSNSTGTFNLSGTGVLNMAGTSTLQIGRSQVVAAATTNTTGLFHQTGGIATVGILAMGGISTDAADNAGANATLTLTGGTFSAVTFSALSGGNSSVSTINIGGTAVVTLPNFPTVRGPIGAPTATLNFDGGTLRNSATGTFITGLTNAFIEDGGARFDTSLNSTTVSQNLLTHGSSLGGGLTKIGANTLTLTGTNTYTGATTINAGTLNLGGATANGSLASTVLTLGGGSLNYSRTGTNSQGFTTTSISGASLITGSATNTLNLGTVTRGTNNSFFDFGTTGLSLISALAASNDASGIMPGFTVDDSWAVANGSGVAISGLAGGSYTQTSAAGATAANYAALNMDVNNSAGLLAGAITTNSLRFSSAAANTVTLATGTNTITTGGILVGSAVGSNLSTITGGTLTSAASKDLAIIQNNASGGLTISSSIIDNTLTSVTKVGAGTLTLTAANTYTGATAIYGGELSLTGSASLGSGTYAGAITNTATLRYSSSANQTLSGVISGAGILIKDTSATSTLTLSNTNTYTGGTTINAGTLKLSGAGTLGPAGASVAVSSGAVLDLNGTNQSITFAVGTGVGTVANNSGSGTSILTLAGTATINGGRVTIVDNTDSSSGKVAVVITANTQPLSNLNTYSGGTTVNAGAFLYLGSATPLGAGTGTINLTASGGSGSGLLVDGTIYANDVSGAGYIHNNTTSGTAVLTGTLNTSGTFNFRNAAAAFDFAGSGNSTLSGVIGPAGTTGAHGPNTTVSGGKITKSGAGTLTLSGANLYSGGTTISGGTLVFRNTGAKASGGTHAFAGNTTLGLGVGGAGFFSSADITSAFGTGTILTNVTVTATTNVAIDTTAGNFTHSADITGSPTKGLTKLGANSLTLGGANTYTGATMVSAGTLLVNNTTGSGTGTNSVTVGINGTLGGSGTISGAVTVDGALKPGNSTGLLSVGSLNLNASSSTTLEINGTNRGAVTNGYDALGLNAGGSLDLGGALSFEFGNLAAFADNTEFGLFSFDTTSTGDFSGVTSTGFYTGTWGKTGDIWSLTDEGQTLNFSEVTGNLTVIPEPGAALLGSIGLLFLLRRRR